MGKKRECHAVQTQSRDKFNLLDENRPKGVGFMIFFRRDESSSDE